jgi:hypothetical protein
MYMNAVLFCINVGCLALYVNEMKHYMYSAIKCVGKIDTFSNTGPNKVSYSRTQIFRITYHH